MARITVIAIWTGLIIAIGAANGQPARSTPPPEPAVRPIVSVSPDTDTNGNRVDDSIDDRVTSAREVLRRVTRGSAGAATAAQRDLDERIKVEFVFSQQITQAQIDAFVAAGGTIDKIFENVSYGWTGRIARSRSVDLPTSMGQSLLGILERKPARLHLDEAARNGRVRPMVWDYGVKGDGSGSDRVCVAILDTGLDGSHTDLAGRMEYWHDWTSDNHLAPQDAGHHGSHVAGIALGNGAAMPSGATELKYTDFGVLPTGGYFSPIHVPLSVPSFTWTSTLRWETGVGTTSARLRRYVRNAAGDFFFFDENSSGASPIVLSESLSNPPGGYTNTFMASAAAIAGADDVAHYAINNTLTYAGPNDGYSVMSGVAPESPWVGLKVFEDGGAGDSVDIGEALDDLVSQRITHKIKVANLSLGFGGPVAGGGIYLPARNKVNTAVQNGIVVVCSAGNDGDVSSGKNGEVSDPGRADLVITVAASDDVNQVTYYSSHGFTAPGDSSGGDDDMKPDISAPGGSVNNSLILSVDSNTGDEGPLPDGVANDYTNMQGTSMASPFMAGCAALVIDAMQRSGEVWDFTGPAALEDALRVKMALLLTATETNQPREDSASGDPALNRGAKDINEGYGMVNADAAVEGYLNAPLDSDVAAGESFVEGVFERRCWARRVNLVNGKAVDVDLSVPATGDYDLYLYGETPDVFGNPVIRASGVNAGNGAAEGISYMPTTTETGWIVVKRVAGDGAWSISGTVPVGLSEFTLE